MSSVNRATVIAVSTVDTQNLSPSRELPNILAVGEGRACDIVRFPYILESIKQKLPHVTNLVLK